MFCRPIILSPTCITETIQLRVVNSGVSRNLVQGGGGSTNSVEDREKGDLGAEVP